MISKNKYSNAKLKIKQRIREMARMTKSGCGGKVEKKMDGGKVGKKPMGYAKGGKVMAFKPCAKCPSPAKCKKAGKCLLKQGK